MLAERGARVGLDQVLVLRHRRGKGWWTNVHLPVVVVKEEREVETQRNASCESSIKPSSAPRCKRSAPSTRSTMGSVSAAKRTVESGGARNPRALVRRGTSRSASAPHRTRRRRGTRAPSPPTPSRTLRADRAPRARRHEAPRGSGHWARPRDAELRATRRLRRVLDLEVEAHVGLVGAVAQHRLRIREPGNGRAGALARRFERRDDHPFEHLEHVLAHRERKLEVELPKLELAVGAKVLVTPARRYLVVAVEPADHEQLLEQLWRLRDANRKIQRVNLQRL